MLKGRDKGFACAAVRFWRRRLLVLLVLLGLAPWAAATEYHGQVFFSGIPVPGATVTVTQGGRHFSTTTDRQGLYEFADLAEGIWKIHIEMRGFAPVEGEAKVTPGGPQGTWELKLLELEQLLSQAEESAPDVPPLQTRSAETSPATAASATPDPGAAKTPQRQQEFTETPADDGFLVSGSVNNAATSQFSLSPAFGNRRPGQKSLYTGGLSLVTGGSAFDANPYSLTGLQSPNTSYSQLNGSVALAGPLKIPHLFYHGPNFFTVYQWTRGQDATVQSGLVPDKAQRSGELSGLCNALGQPVTVLNPATGLPFTGPVPVSPQAQALLNLYPLPNVAGNSRYNYQTQVRDSSHSDALQLRLDKSVDRRDQVYGKFEFQSTRADNANLFQFRDTTDTLGLESDVNWSHRFHNRFLMKVGYQFSRLRVQVTPAFQDRANISGEAGITGNSQDRANWGPPSLLFSSGIAPLADGESKFNRNRSDSLSVGLSTMWRHHTFTFGGDFRRREFNELAQQNPRGTFVFTGAATAGGTSAGSDLADFLLGIPDTAAVAYGNADKYFRQSIYDAYFSDEWRVRPVLSITAGIRWDHGSPLTELFGRLVNLDLAQGFAAAVPVLGSNPTGAITGAVYPSSLMRPDKRLLEPRLGVAWRPLPASTVVVRAGYGIYTDTSVYLSAARLMAQQMPFSRNISVANSSACPLTLANGFRNCAGAAMVTFAVDPNFRVGYAQAWQLQIQRDLPGALVATMTYSGVKGTHGVQEFLPNTYPAGASDPCPACPRGFSYVTSGGNSIRHAGEVQLRRRLRHGVTAKIDYTYSKSIDNDAQVGAQNVTPATAIDRSSESTAPASLAVAQNWLDLRGERALSNFDQRNMVKAQLQYTSGMGLGGGTLMGGTRGKLLKDWTLATMISAGSGLPQTPVYLAAVAGTGTTGTIRPDLTGASLYEQSSGRFLNPAAYSAPASGQWGTARRNSITGPSQFSLNASLARTFRLQSPFSLDVRLDAANLLNHPVFSSWNTVVNSTTFGLPAAVNAMRTVRLTGRLRF